DPSQPCVGDSGGPVLVGTRVVAIVSAGDVACASYARASRVSAFLDFLSPHAPLEGGCAVATGPRSSILALLVLVFGVFRHHRSVQPSPNEGRKGYRMNTLAPSGGGGKRQLRTARTMH